MQNLNVSFGIDRLQAEPELRKQLHGRSWGLVAHPASVNRSLRHSLDVLVELGVQIACAFGPQHGMRGEKQYNMIESEDYVDPIHKIPVFSLYGEHRKPTDAMMSACQGVIVDLQDVGCRIYTYLTTLAYVMEACARAKKPVVVLDRPNPAGRKVEGLALKPGQESFVGVAPIPMRHGLTLGEIAFWLRDFFKWDLELSVIEITGYHPDLAPEWGWVPGRPWINPSPNLPNLNGVRCYPGTVLLEGTMLSEGRGTTRPLEGFGAPDLEGQRLCAAFMSQVPESWRIGAFFRPFYFEPVTYKYEKKLCSGVQFHTDFDGFDPALFSPYRAMMGFFKTIRTLYPEYVLWREFAYEYVFDRLAIDVIQGGNFAREWVDDPSADWTDFESVLIQDERAWVQTRAPYLKYGR